MAYDDDYRRRMSNTYLDRRQDRLDLAHSQERRRHAVYSALRTGNEAAARMQLGVAPSRAAATGTASHAGEFDALVTEVRTRRLAVLDEIDALGHLSNSVRREWHVRFDAIDVWLRTADESIDAFEAGVKTVNDTLRNIARRLQAAIESLDPDPAQNDAWANTTLSFKDTWIADLYFGGGFGGVARQVEHIAFLDDATRQRWAGELRRIDGERNRAPFFVIQPRSLTTGTSLAGSAREVLVQVDAAARCSSLQAALSLLRAASRRFRATL